MNVFRCSLNASFVDFGVSCVSLIERIMCARVVCQQNSAEHEGNLCKQKFCVSLVNNRILMSLDVV